MPISAVSPFESRWVGVHGSRMHYVETGSGDPILFVHGMPASSYAWRNVLPYAAPHGRAIAVDLIGMGRSDKPDLDYRFTDHMRYLDGFIEALGLDRVTLVLHGWAGVLGLSWARRHASRVRAISLLEAVVVPRLWSELPVGERVLLAAMRNRLVGDLMNQRGRFLLTVLMPRLTRRRLSRAEMTAYLAPFPTPLSRRPVAQWPREMPLSGQPVGVHAEVQRNYEWLRTAPLPKLLLHASPGVMIPAAVVSRLRREVFGLTDSSIGRGLHYVQEDQPDAIGRVLDTWLRAQRF